MRKLKLMSDSGCAAVKTLVSTVLLPVILFNAFLFADYSRESLAIIIVFGLFKKLFKLVIFAAIIGLLLYLYSFLF